LASVPPQAISMSSGCAPTAITSRCSASMENSYW
jgi:hypothetical protein